MPPAEKFLIHCPSCGENSWIDPLPPGKYKINCRQHRECDLIEIEISEEETLICPIPELLR